MPVTPEQIRHIATLARLNLPQSEITQLASDIAAILVYVDNLQQVNAPRERPESGEMLFIDLGRDDIIRPSLPATDALQNAPKRQGDFFLVPRVIS